MAEQIASEDLEEHAEPATTPSRTNPLAVWGSRAAKWMVGFLPKMGLFLFMVLLPVLMLAYPAYRVSERLTIYAQARNVDARLTDIDIRTVETGQDQASLFESRKHFDVMFAFEGEQKKKYVAVAEMSWPSPGLHRKLSSEYVIGDTYTLYLLPDQSIVMDDEVARDSFHRLSCLMGLVFCGTAVFFLLWKRLAGRIPRFMPTFPSATQKSFMLGQLIALVVAGIMSVLITLNPLAVNPWLFVGVYWGLTLFVTLSLRLLVFEGTPAVPASVEKPEEPRPRGAGAARR